MALGVNRATAAVWLNTWHARGLIYVIEHRIRDGKPSQVWAWQPDPNNLLPDHEYVRVGAERPGRRRRKRPRKPKVTAISILQAWPRNNTDAS